MGTALAQMNLWADQIASTAWSLFWQSSVLIALLLALDLVLRKHLRASVRYALWLVLLVKLVLPPTLALPTGISWWVRQRSSVPVKVEPSQGSFVVRYGPTMSPLGEPKINPTIDSISQAILTQGAWMVLFSGGVSLGLFLWMLIRWRQVVMAAQPSLTAPEWMVELFAQTQRSIGLRGCVRLRIVDQAMSPAVCGLLRPAVLVPRALVERLSAEQMRSILLHELIHLKRWDVWVNCTQALLQIAYWWHPLLWLANARIRRVREEAVDDAVMVALQDKAEAYAPTLVQVARLSLSRPITALGLVGILESPGALRQRIERLLEFRPPRRAGLSLASALCILGFAAMALPMGPAPGHATIQLGETDSAGTATNLTSRITKLLQEAKSLYEAGDSREAEVKLLRVLQEAPENESAHYYLNLIREAEYQRLGRTSTNALKPVGQATTPPPRNSLYTRSFMVNPSSFSANLFRSMGILTNSELPALRESLVKFFESAGVELAPPKTLYYKDNDGRLIVRATLADLDLIEHAINELNNPPPQINVKVKFVELPVKLSRLFWEGLTNGATREAILTEPQALVALKALETKEGVGVVKEGSVTTLSGRQTQFQWVDMQTVVTATNGTGTGIPKGAWGLVTNVVRIGPVVDIYPFVGADGFTIQLTVSASTTEFLGYDDPGQFVPQAPLGLLTLPITAPLPLPHFRVLQLPTQSAVVWDGQTLVLGRSGQIDVNQVPVFGGDRPLAGRLFRSEPKDKDFIVFLTPTIIDPAGNRVHSADESPGPDPKSK